MNDVFSIAMRHGKRRRKLGGESEEVEGAQDDDDDESVLECKGLIHKWSP